MKLELNTLDRRAIIDALNEYCSLVCDGIKTPYGYKVEYKYYILDTATEIINAFKFGVEEYDFNIFQISVLTSALILYREDNKEKIKVNQNFGESVTFENDEIELVNDILKQVEEAGI